MPQNTQKKVSGEDRWVALVLVNVQYTYEPEDRQWKILPVRQRLSLICFRMWNQGSCVEVRLYICSAVEHLMIRFIEDILWCITLVLILFRNQIISGFQKDRRHNSWSTSKCTNTVIISSAYLHIVGFRLEMLESTCAYGMNFVMAEAERSLQVTSLLTFSLCTQMTHDFLNKTFISRSSVTMWIIWDNSVDCFIKPDDWQMGDGGAVWMMSC